jgi:hypothetical protein
MDKLMRLTTDRLSSILNTPHRLSRIEEFTVKLKIETVEGNNTVIFNTSEPVIMNAEDLERINTMIKHEINKLGDKAVYNLNRMLTDHCRTQLTLCSLFFEGEKDFNLRIKDHETIRLSRDGFVVHKIQGA